MKKVAKIHLLYLLLLLGILLLACQKAQEDPLVRYFQNKKVLILGNSITQAGHYVDYLSYFLEKNHPEIEIDIISIGLSSETVSCLTEPDHPFPRPCLKERLDRALKEIKPAVVFACYGMNDGIYHPNSEARMKAFQSGILDLIKNVSAIDAELVLLSPPTFDALPIKDRLVEENAAEFGYKTPFKGYDVVLAAYANWLQGLSKEKVKIIDLHTKMKEEIRTKREADPQFSFARDGIHPDFEGHLLMAKIIWEGLGLKGELLSDQNAWEIREDKLFQQVSDQRDIQSQAWRNYVGFIRGDTVKTNSPKPMLVLMAGQSNMVGQGEIPKLPAQANNFYYINHGQNWKGKVIDNKIGPEEGLQRYFQENWRIQHRPVLLLKYAIGGSSLLDWAPEYSREKAKITGNERFGNMFETFFQYIDSVQEIYDPEVKALLWMQGERDARIPEAGKDYYENFKKFITELRNRLGKPNLPIIFAKVNPPLERYAAVKIVNEAQTRIANEMEGAYMIETEGLGKFKDQVHYNTEGQIELGKRFGEALAKYLK